tara:strand:- start:401 stop:1111 length:711 start_codon:yes stop_codon:yes gene_type:complete
MSYLKNFSSLIKKKQNLLKCIFLTLIFQFLVSTLVFMGMYNSNIVLYKETDENKIKKNLWKWKLGIFIFLIVTIGLVILMTSISFTFNQRFAIFSLFSFLQGVFLGLCLKFVDYNLLLSVLTSTLFLLVSMLLVGFGMVFFKQDLSWLGIILFMILLGLISIRIIGFFMPYTSEFNKMIAGISIVLFSIYIIYDTNIILLRYNAVNYGRDCIVGALDYYLDTINIFVNMLSYTAPE